MSICRINPVPFRVGITREVFGIFLLLYLLFTAVNFSLAAEKPVMKRILMIYSYHEGLPWERIIDDSFRATHTCKILLIYSGANTHIRKWT